MKTKKNKYGTTVLTAGEGMTIVGIDGSVSGKTVYLGCNDLAANYREVTDEDALAMQSAGQEEVK